MQQTNPKVALQRLNLARDASFRQAKGIGGAGKLSSSATLMNSCIA